MRVSLILAAIAVALTSVAAQSPKAQPNPFVAKWEITDIYGWKRADPPPVANAPGELQSLSVVVVGNHVTASFNGKKVHDNAVLYAWTGGALDNKEDQPGPIMIQGDHSRVAIKKLIVTPITKAGM